MRTVDGTEVADQVDDEVLVIGRPFRADDPTADLEGLLRESEAEMRRWAARRAAIVAEAERRGVFKPDGHASVTAWVRAVTGCSLGESLQVRRLARLMRAFDKADDAVQDARISPERMDLIARAYANPRCADQLADFIDLLLCHGETLPFEDFKLAVDHFVAMADADGAHRSHEESHARRTAFMGVINATTWLNARGGNTQGAEMTEIFGRYVQAEFETDWAEVRAEHGDAATPSMMRRTDAQRRFDALHQIFRDAASTPADAQAPLPVVSIVIDQETWRDVVTRVLGEDAANRILDRPPRRERRDPRTRRCQTVDGIVLDPLQVFTAVFCGRVRRVVFDSKGVVIDLGHARRLFAGAAREAVRLSSNRCLWPGCTLRSGRCQTDHNDDWADGGPSDQDNAGPLCRRHNLWKNRGFRVWRDEAGLWHVYRPDGSEIC